MIGSSPSPYSVLWLYRRSSNHSSHILRRFSIATRLGIFPSSVLWLVLHTSPSVKLGDKRRPSSSLEWLSAASLGEAKCSERCIDLFISTLFILKILFCNLGFGTWDLEVSLTQDSNLTIFIMCSSIFNELFTFLSHVGIKQSFYLAIYTTFIFVVKASQHVLARKHLRESVESVY